MTRESSSKVGENLAPPNPMLAEFALIGKNRIEQFTSAQEELLDQFQQGIRQWTERVQSESDLAAEFAAKLSAARSIPDATTVCLEWTNQRFERMAEDGRRLFADAQKFMEIAARPLWNSWTSGHPSIST